MTSEATSGPVAPPRERISGMWTGNTWYSPPLTRWGRTYRLLLVLLISAAAWSAYLPYQLDHAPWWLVGDVLLGVVALVLTRWRRRWPLAVALLTSVLGTVSATAGGPATLASVSLATRRRWREILPVSLLGLVAALTLDRMAPDVSGTGPLLTIAISVLVIGITIAWGMYIGSRRELLATLRERADRAEAEQEQRVAAARQAERTRIAREMHDVLAHRISLVTVHAGAMAYREDLSAGQLREAAGVIEEGSRQALVELRQVLGVLRDDPGDAQPERPQPSAADLPGLVEEARAAGLRVEVLQDVDLGLLPADLGRTAYRVVQEALTNARKHAPGARVRLHLAGAAGDGVDVEVRNPLEFGSGRRPAPESGLGLVGLTERTALAGGRLDWEVTPQREFVLRAWLPWPA